MYLKNIELFQFRNFIECISYFSKQINFIIGDNAQGKTNFLEAIYLLCLLKSFRTHQDDDWVSFSHGCSRVAGTFLDEAGIEHQLAMEYDLQEGKKIHFNGKKVHQFSEVIGNFPAVVFSAHDFDIINGSPIVRRRLFNILIAQCSKRYLHVLKEYEKILKQRNRVLYQLAQTRSAGRSELDIWSQQLIQAAIPVMELRRQFISEVNTLIDMEYRRLDPGEGSLQIEYSSNIPEVMGEEPSLTYQKILSKIHRQEIQRTFTLYGPHRDDYLFKINERPLKNYGSRGEHKSVLVCLKAAECHLLRQKLGIGPIILLDDIFSELDRTRGRQAFSLYSQLGQCFLTGTTLDPAYWRTSDGLDRKCFRVVRGAIMENAGNE